MLSAFRSHGGVSASSSIGERGEPSDGTPAAALSSMLAAVPSALRTCASASSSHEGVSAGASDMSDCCPWRRATGLRRTTTS
eukprot:4089246-Prymnesium_polylepis.2